MISIDRVYKTVLTFANSDIRGNVDPSELKLAVNDVVNEIYEEYLYELNRLVNRENRGFVNGGLENLPDRLREKILHFLTEAELYGSDETDYAQFDLEDDIRYFDSIYYNGRELEPCKNMKEFKLISDLAETIPSDENPIYVKVSNTIRVIPNTIDIIDVFYLRQPIIANWAYTVVLGAELVNPGAADYRDIDLHHSEENNVVLRTLKRFGINLKEQDLQQITSAEENKDFNQENTN